MTERSHAYAVRSAMTKTPRNPPSSPGAPRPPAAAPRSDAARPPPAEAPEADNPFASLASSPFGEPGGETKLYEVPRELIEIARAKAAEPKATTGTLTPIAPRPNAELEATLAAYTAGLAATSSTRSPSSAPAGGEPPAGAYEESGTVLRRDAARAAEAPQPLAAPLGSAVLRREAVPRSDSARSDSPRSDSPRSDSARSDSPRSDSPRGDAAWRSDSPLRSASERLPVLERKPVLRSPVSPSSKPAARPRSTPASAAAAHKRPWALYLGVCLLLGYCTHLLLNL